MKKLKYLFTFMFALLLVPSFVHATETIYFKNFNVGDEINVTLSADGSVKGKFIVVATSPQGEQKNVENFQKGNENYEYVTAMYVGNLGKAKFGSKVDGAYQNSTARSALVINATNAKWDTYEEIRLLNLDDIANIGSSGNSVNKSWAYQNAPLWLGENAIDTTAYMLRADGSFGLENISTEANIVPVVRIHKGWVEGAMICNCDDCLTNEKFCPADPSISIQACIDGGTSESVCIMQLCTKENKVCPKDPSISIQACLDKGTSEAECVKKLCNKVCPNDPSMDIQECIDGGMSEEDCVKKLCNKVCPNDPKIDIQSCINGGMSEENCIKKLCPGSENVENPKTGAYVTLGLGTILFLLASYLLSKRKNYFSKVK